MVVVATQTHLYHGGDGGSRSGDGDGVETWWRWMQIRQRRLLVVLEGVWCDDVGVAVNIRLGTMLGADVGWFQMVVVWAGWGCVAST
ncbi:hypothetical protein Tco_0186434 [Tanacetum coccineum]